MNNEIGRKLTSLTLMTIMLAGGMVIAAPSMVPQAMAANESLFVSAENSLFDNTFSGPSVIEIVVSDTAIMSLDDAHGMPDVTVNGNDVVMAQATDGSWYAYIADKTYSQKAMETSWSDDKGLNFGFQCTAATASTATSSTGASFGSTQTVFFASSTTSNGSGAGGSAPGTSTGAACDYDTGSGTVVSYDENINVVRDAKSLNQNTALKGHTGQIGLVDTEYWPFIQTYSFNPTGNVVVEYKKAGQNEVSILKFDTTSPTQSVDRTNVPDNAEVFLTIGDPSLNIDPTSIDQWAFDTNGKAFYMAVSSKTIPVADLMFSEGDLKWTASSSSGNILQTRNNADFSDLTAGTHIGIIESGENTSIFGSSDDNDQSTLYIHADATRGQSGKLDYESAVSIVMTNHFGILNLDESSVGDEWNSGEEISVTLIDEDFNFNTQADEDFNASSTTFSLIPSLQIGSPIVIATSGASVSFESHSGSSTTLVDTGVTATTTVDSFSHIARAVLGSAITNDGTAINVDVDTGMTIANYNAIAGGADVAEYLNYDLRSIVANAGTVTAITATVGTSGTLTDITTAVTLDKSGLGFISIADGADSTSLSTANVYVRYTISTSQTVLAAATYPIVTDIFAFGDKVNNAIYRMQLEESGDNTATFEGSIEYVMVNQINFKTAQIVTTVNAELTPIADSIVIIVTEDLTDEDGPRVNYLDLGADGVSTQIADQQDAPTHSGVADLDMDTYKTADTVNFTITDMDLNTDSELIDIYQVQANDSDGTASTVELFTITFDDNEWAGIANKGVSLVETNATSGIFVGSFQIPTFYTGTTTATGTDIEINYLDHRDASGETIEVGDGAGVRANTGTISLDRTVYPVPWGDVTDNFGSDTGAANPNGKSVFPNHATSLSGNVTADNETISNGSGDLTVHIRVNDADLDVSAAGQDKMEADVKNSDGEDQSVGPIKIEVSRGTDKVVLAYAGGDTVKTTGVITVGGSSTTNTRALGPVTEVAGDTGIFELDFTIRYTDGPASTTCPATNASGFTSLSGDTTNNEEDRFDTAAVSGKEYCILQGDILTVEYTDANDASGNKNTVTDSATFDLRNGVLQSDKSVYIIGGDMILTIIEPDWDLDNDSAESYDLDVVEWDSDAQTTTLDASTNFDPEPSKFRETGDSTGIFQVVIEVPSTLNSNLLERGEQIDLQYTDWGPSGSDFVGQEDEDMNVTVYTSNFGATVELDQKVYTWTDKVYITIVAPDHNFDNNLVDTIGNTANDAVKIATRSYDVDKYSLVETGTDTGIFTGEIILTGFSHDSNGDGTKTGPANSTSADSTGPTDGYIETSDDDGLTVSFEYSADKTVVGSALIRWNIGEVQWLEASYPASGTGVVRIIDSDMNLNPESVDNFSVNVWSDSDSGGINLTVTETNEATGIFEGTVFFTVDDASSGHRLRVSEGDTVTSEYEDNTLPDPYTTADELNITSTTLIGTVVPPLERAPAANLRTVDAFGNSLDAVSVDQQVQLTADLSNGQDKEQAFAYLVQIQNESGVTVSLAWITGSLSAGQSFSPALSWIPTEAGSFTATAFVWESVDNPTALSSSVSTTVNVR